MLITNMQALECVTLFASMLKKEGVVANIYNICQVDLKDFSLQGKKNHLLECYCSISLNKIVLTFASFLCFVLAMVYANIFVGCFDA